MSTDKMIYFIRSVSYYMDSKTRKTEYELKRFWREMYISGEIVSNLAIRYNTWAGHKDTDSLGNIQAVVGYDGKECLIVRLNDIKTYEELNSSGLLSRKEWEF